MTVSPTARCEVEPESCSGGSGKPVAAGWGRCLSGDGQVRDPTTWTVLQHDGPNHLGLWYNVLPEQQMAGLLTVLLVAF